MDIPIPFDKEAVMLDKIKALVQKKDMCVLATVSGGDPHCSLMAYTADRPCRRIYMVTHKKTRKYKNLERNPYVSLMIDTRDEDMGLKRREVKAITISGMYEPVEEEGKEQMLRTQFLARHPHMEDFMNDPDASILSIRITSFLLLEGLADAHFEPVG